MLTGAYVATKHSVVGVAHALRLEPREQGIRVGIILPGRIDIGQGA